MKWPDTSAHIAESLASLPILMGAARVYGDIRARCEADLFAGFCSASRHTSGNRAVRPGAGCD